MLKRRVIGMTEEQVFQRLQKALEKGHLMATGFSYNELSRPLIAVANSWAEWQGHVHLRSLAEAVKAGIRSAGATPLEFNTIALCDRLTGYRERMRYSLPSRDLIADSVEVYVRGQPIFDGLVLIATCDKIVPGMLMAAARLDMPTIFVPGGLSVPLVGAGEASKKGWARKAFLRGEISEVELLNVIGKFYSCPGACSELGTATTMQCVSEALGLAIPGSAVIPANGAEQLRLAKETGEQIVEIVRERVTARDILTRKAFENAIMMVQAMGGSLNSVLHIPAIAKEAGIKITYEDFDRFESKVPLLCGVVPNGPHTVMDFYLAGGVPALMKRLEPVINLDSLTMTMNTLGENIKDLKVNRRDVLRSMDTPLQKVGGITVVRGNIAEIGGIVKRSAVPEEFFRFKGPARVYDKGEAFFKAIEQREIEGGEIVIIRYEGALGGPGMPELPGDFFSYMAKDNALITDGRFSGTHYGLLIGYIKPEAAEGGNIGLIKDGDEVEIDIPSKRINSKVSSKELEGRRKGWVKPEVEVEGYLRKWLDCMHAPIT